jgi:uncharacterized protein YndB with AHSA1/START domain
MIKVDYHVPIRRSPEDVYAYVTDVERIPEWQHVAGVRKVTMHDAGPLRVGSRFTMVRESRGNVATIDATVTALEPGRRFDFHTIDDDGFAGDFATTLTGGEGTTDLHWSVRMEPAGFLYRLLQPVIAREIRKSATADFGELRSKLEGGAAGGAM